MQGRVIAVTGGFGTLGQVIGAVLLAQGASVALIDRAEEPPAMLPPDSGNRLLLGGVDLTDAPQAVAAIARIATWQGGRVDALVNVAGGFHWEGFAAGSLDTWDQMYALNLRTAVATCQAALPALVASGRGAIVNIGAASAVKAASGMGAYAASKAGVARLTEALADELRDGAVTVNAVLPAIVDTPQNRRDMPDADPGRWVTPAAIGELVLFLLSDRAREITGALIPISNKS